MMKKWRLKLKMLPKIFGLICVLVLSACSNDPGTGPKDVRWDRDACERCRMVLSDPHFAAQVRYFPKDKRSKVLKFDDIGCAVLWLKGKSWETDNKTEIWVADYRSGEWLDARTATYVSRKVTPMEYGLGAQAEPIASGLNYEQAITHIEDIEKRFNIHGLQLQQRLQEQSLQRENIR